MKKAIPILIICSLLIVVSKQHLTIEILRNQNQDLREKIEMDSASYSKLSAAYKLGLYKDFEPSTGFEYRISKKVEY